MDYSKLTLGQLLSSDDITIKRNAISILKVCQKCDHKFEAGQCIYCFSKEQAKTIKCRNQHEGIKCPLCGEFVYYKLIDGVHAWPCEYCPFKGIEQY